MKRMTFLMTVMASLMMLAGCEKDDRSVALNSLPQKAQTFVDTHFGGLTITSVVKEYDDLTYDYDVYFSNGTSIEFNRSGEWKDIDCHGSKVPDSVVPEKVLNYVKSNYPSNVIVQLTIDGLFYDVELDNDLDLVFGKGGDFVRIDY